ncbi:MAG: SCO family protein [Myxococcota bacterium]|nr:SCO family protein [Myxococcota bacterium]
MKARGWRIKYMRALRASCVLLLLVALAGDHSAQAKSDSGRSSGTRWGADYFPNVVLVSHEGRSLRFFDDLIKDKVVVVNFIYASCPDACPLDTARLSKVQQILGDRVGRDIFMYSITIDPDLDTPEVLAEYAKRYRAGPGWLFLTGNEADILLLRKKLGLYIEGLDTKLKDHNMNFIIGNQRTGRWMKRSPMDNPYFIAEQIGSWLSNWQTPSEFRDNNYAQAPELKAPSMGENLFRTRCTVCHTIGAASLRTVGGGEKIETGQHRLGPDLLHVTHRRDRAWLTRWLANPEKMLAERDPLVLDLYAEWGEVLMPNLRLNEIEIEALIEYMDAETRRVQQEAPVAGSARAHAPGAQHH